MRWQDDKAWTDAFLPSIKRILGLYLIGEATRDEDQERNTDLIVLKMDAVRIAVRIRRAAYFARYSEEFTLRRTRPSGVKTELAKIVEGWGNYFFYGFADDSDFDLQAWTLADLNVFRLWFNTQLVKFQGRIPGRTNSNADGSSEFVSFYWRELPENFIVASSRPTRPAPQVAAQPEFFA